MPIDNSALSMHNRLVELDCCDRCIVRFLGLEASDEENPYKFPREYLNKTLNLPTDDGSDECEQKKVKRNICRVCMYAYDFETIEKLLESIDFSPLNDYQCDTFQFSVSFPKCLAIRTHSMYFYLKKNFPDVVKQRLYDSAVEGTCLELPHKIFRLLFIDLLAEKIGKKYNTKSTLKVHLNMAYENDKKEIENMKQLLSKTETRKHQSIIEASRSIIVETLKSITDDVFVKYFPVPPELPDKSVFFEKFQANADPLYLGGRYMKFKRNVGQTPWIIDGVCLAEHNVQETIFNAVSKVLNIDASLLTFTASGREDVDVRMLGTGRPFYIKISNPQIIDIQPEQLLEIEKLVIETELIAVVKLKIVNSTSLDKIKLGEEEKIKTYRALCKTSAPNVTEAVQIINSQTENLLIIQLTVMRVLHRRSLLPRERIVHKMNATEISDYPNMFELVISTQAGTYIKEFVHGDFCRTRPSITSIIGYPTDVLALDCIDIDLEWP